jgi:hypothetical protein
LQRVGIDALVRALGPVGMACFLQQFDQATAITRPVARQALVETHSHGNGSPGINTP